MPFLMPALRKASLLNLPFQGEYFMVQDVYSKADVLNTSGSCGAPNFRQVKGGYPLYGMGQPSLNGFKQVLQWLQAQGHEVSDAFFSSSPLDRHSH